MPVRSRLIFAAAGAVILVAGSFGAGWMVNGWRHDAKLARVESQHAQVLEQLASATTASVQAARTEEARRTAAVEEQRDIAQNKLDGLALDVAAGRATADRLRIELDALRRRGGACNPAAADGSPSQQSVDPIGVLIDVLTRMESDGREVAEYADRLRIAGAACEGAWDRLRAGPQ